MAKEEAMRMSGTVTEVLGNAMFRVKLNNTEHYVTAYVGGKMRKHDIKIIAAVKPLDYQINLSRLLKDHLLI